MPVEPRAAAVSPASLRLVPGSVWAGVLEVLFALATVTVAMLPGITGATSGRDQSAAIGGTGPGPLALAVLVIALLSIRFALIFGLLEQRRWARPLYLWSLGPVVLGTLLLLLARGDAFPAAARMAGIVTWLGLTGLQAWLVLRSATRLTH